MVRDLPARLHNNEENANNNQKGQRWFLISSAFMNGSPKLKIEQEKITNDFST